MPIDITTDGFWTLVTGTPSAGPVFIDVDNNGTDERIEFGLPANASNGSSAYVFTGISTSALTDGSLFALGDFTHENFAVRPESITGATLNLGLDFTTQMVSQSFTFAFLHEETPNNANPCAAGGGNPCADRVTIPNASSLQFVQLSGIDYLLAINGFSTDMGQTFTAGFITAEGQSNTATLFGSLQAVPTDVPEPPLVALLGAGALVMTGLRRRQRRSAP